MVTHRRLLLAVIGLSLLSLAAAGCGGSSKHTATTAPSTTVAPTTSTTTGGLDKLGDQADQLCAQADDLERDLASLHLSTPSDLGSSADALSTDLGQLETALSGLSGAASAQGHTRQIAGVVDPVHQAQVDVINAVGKLSSGDLATASADIDAAQSSLRSGVTNAGRANLGDCASRPTASTSTTG